MSTVDTVRNGWRLTAGGLTLDVDKHTGCLAGLSMTGGKPFDWSRHPGDVTVRDDRLQRTFGRFDVAGVTATRRGQHLTLHKAFHGAPWILKEVYSVEDDVIHWTAELVLDAGDFRSCAVSYRVPWPQPLYSVAFWAAREGMPSAPHRFAEIALEYGETTSGICLPALCSYIEKRDVGLLMTMPFDFRTPRFRFISGFRDPDLRAEFDRMALAPGKPARTSLLLRATGGDWRPALGWLYERYREYFDPRSASINSLWGGHVCGHCNVSLEQARAMADLGLSWHEIHVHFPAYGNYHPEGLDQWRSGHAKTDPTVISVEMIRETIRNLHAVKSAAMPYIQVTGDGDLARLPPGFEDDRVLDIHGEPIWSDHYEFYQLNSALTLPFGRDITRQIDGMVERYPEMDGVFLDQACYNYLDTAHDDGITAVDNRPAYMTGFNYFPHLEQLASRLHPRQSIIANGPYGIGIMKYIDGFMSEGSGWLCDQFQYYGLNKPMFFLVYNHDDRSIERMFQKCLIYGAGYTSYAAAANSRDLYRAYVPVLERLFRRRWVFDPNPLALPSGFDGGVFRAPRGDLLVSVVSGMGRLTGSTRTRRRRALENSVLVRTADIDEVRRVTWHTVGAGQTEIPFRKENGGLVFDVPDNTVAAVAELSFRRARNK